MQAKSVFNRWVSFEVAVRYARVVGGRSGPTNRDINGYQLLLDFWGQPIAFIR